jgi:hypothetical protein
MLYLDQYRDRHGKVRRYVRNRITGKRIALTAAPDEAGFMSVYQSALLALGLTSLPDADLQRRRVMHRPEDNGKWQHWIINRSKPGNRWHRVVRTKCVSPPAPLQKVRAAEQKG